METKKNPYAGVSDHLLVKLILRGPKPFFLLKALECNDKKNKIVFLKPIGRFSLGFEQRYYYA